MQVRKQGNKIEVDPPTPELVEALNAIESMGSPDKLVTYALRRHGYGNDGWCVTYSNDQDELEKDEHCIPEGYVEICCVGCGEETGPIMQESMYLQLLSEVCELYNLEDRSEILKSFLENPEIACVLLEADSKKCNARWKKFVPFLEGNGWKIEEGRMNHDVSNSYYSIDAFTEDLDVLYRETKRKIKAHPDAREEWVDYQKTILTSLEKYLEYERNHQSNKPLNSDAKSGAH